MDAGRAGCETGHAAKAGVEVTSKAVRDRGLALKPPLNEGNATPWSVGLSPPQDVSRAGRQTEAAVDTIGDKLGVGWVMTVKRQRSCRHDTQRSLIISRVCCRWRTEVMTASRQSDQVPRPHGDDAQIVADPEASCHPGCRR